MLSCTPSSRPTLMSMVAAKSLVAKSVTSAGTVCRLPTKGRLSSARELLQPLLGVALGGLVRPELVDLVLELLVLLAHRAVVDGAGQEAAHRLDDVVHPRADRGEGVGGHGLDPGGDPVESAPGVERDDGDRGQDQDQQRGAGTAGAPRRRHRRRAPQSFSAPRR